MKALEIIVSISLAVCLVRIAVEIAKLFLAASTINDHHDEENKE